MSKHRVLFTRASKLTPKKLESCLLAMNFTMAEPAICEHTWVNWCELSPIHSLLKHGLHSEAVCSSCCCCVCVAILIKKSGLKTRWNDIFWEHAPRSLIRFMEVQYWKSFGMNTMKCYTSHDLTSHCFTWCMDIWSCGHDSWSIIAVRY